MISKIMCGKGVNMIYVVLRGRIGNQLFIYAYANALRENKNEMVIIDDSAVLKEKWIDSLENYNLPNVKFVHKKKLLSPFLKQFAMDFVHQKKILRMPFMKKYSYQVKRSDFFLKNGYIAFENGYYNLKRKTKNLLIDGYFQSEKYFFGTKEDILEQYNLSNDKLLNKYNGIDKIRKRNSVCISIKIEHNVGSSMYDVCTKEYWIKAIRYIEENVENPLFFICSDNVDYVKENLIDCTKFDAICQDMSMPVHISLAAMSQCKHFIIGNTSYGWWAQYMCNYSSKIVVAPSKWMKIDMPIDIYQDNWTIIDV